MDSSKAFFLLSETLILAGLAAAATAVRGQSDDGAAGALAAPSASSTPVNVFTAEVLDSAGEPVVGVSVAVAAVDSGSISWNKTLSARAPEEKVLLFFSKRNGKRSGTATTDANGRFAIRNLMHGRYNLAVIEPAVGATLLADLSFLPDAKPARITLDPVFDLNSTLTFKGRVLDSQGKPVPNAEVALADAEHGHIAHEFYLELSTESAGVTFGPQVGSTAENSAKRTLWASSSEPIEGFEWFLVRTGRAAHCRTNQAGEFSITGLRTGTYNLVTIHHASGATVLQDVTIDTNTPPIEVKLDAPLFAEGALKGLKLPRDPFGIKCTLVPEGLPDRVDLTRSVRFHGDGEFRVGPLPPAKCWRLIVVQPVPSHGYAATMLDAPLDLRTGRLDLDVNRGKKIDGEVRGPEGKPLQGVSVLARPLDGSSPTLGAVSDADGKYSLRGLACGRYELVAIRHTKRTAPG